MLPQEDKEATIAGVRAVNTSRADLGIVVDTDANSCTYICSLRCCELLLQEDKEAMIAGVRAVNTSRADLGIVVDTDVDRSAVVAGNGTPINSNRYIALMSYITLRCAQPCPTCPLDSSAQLSLGLQGLSFISYL